ncbi:class E sortase [Citricoccus zhacaiensis]
MNKDAPASRSERRQAKAHKKANESARSKSPKPTKIHVEKSTEVKPVARRRKVDGVTIVLRSVVGAMVAAVLVFGTLAAVELYASLDAPAQEHAAEVLKSVPTKESEDAASTADEGADDGSAAKEVAAKRKAAPDPKDATAGQAFGSISSPLLGTQPIVKSDQTSNQATQEIIDTGVVAAYESLANPGEIGNFAVTGHRITHGSVFKEATNLRVGDEITATTNDGTFTYRVIREAVSTHDADNSMLDSNPLGSVANDDRALMTLITCGQLWEGKWIDGKWRTIREVVVLELVEPEKEQGPAAE